MTVSIVTTCKGRLAFLRRTLPAMIATGLSVMVVDYDCPEGSGDFVTANFPSVDLLRVADRPFFNLAEARNLGARRSRGDVLAFVDADTMLQPGFAAFARQTDFTTDVYFTGDGALAVGAAGACIVARRHLERVGGYDELMAGWGYEDLDFYQRLSASGQERRFLPHDLIAPIPHADELRVAFAEQKDKWASLRANRLYSLIKIDAEGVTRRNLSMSERQHIRALVQDAVTALNAKPKGAALPLSIHLGEEHFGGVARLARSLAYTLTLG